jgi:uncharacterized protein (DUF302 family)
MRERLQVSLCKRRTHMSPKKENGIATRPSRHSVDETVQKLVAQLQAKQVRLFALIGMRMHPTELLIFGNPKAWTPLMVASPSSAIDLPLKIHVWKDADTKVWLSYNTPAYLQERHDLPRELVPNLAIIESLTEKAGE